MLCLAQSLIPLILVSLFHLAASGCCYLQCRLYSLAGLSPPLAPGPGAGQGPGVPPRPFRRASRPSGAGGPAGGQFEGCFVLKGSGLPGPRSPRLAPCSCIRKLLQVSPGDPPGLEPYRAPRSSCQAFLGRSRLPPTETKATGHNQWYLLLLLVESPLSLKPRGSSRFDSFSLHLRAHKS
jgi:hypothetical protein